MPSALKSPQRAIQLTLYHPVRNEPRWEALPIEIRQQVLHLLARMLRGHLAWRRGEPAVREDRDD
jgi:hypothetical protein